MNSLTDDDDDELETEDILSFHSNVRENIIFVLLLLMLLTGSYTLIERFRRRDQKDLFSSDDDELTVYRISLLFCIFSFAVALGSSGLLPLSIISNEVLLHYPDSYWLKWLNSSLISSLWSHVFLFSNLAIFVLLPFAYLFSESSGFIGHKKGIIPRFYETMVVFFLLCFVGIGLIYVLLASIYPERSSFLSMFSITTYHLPFLYSCVSFIGVLLLLVCTPIGFIRLFSVVGQVLVKPNLMRDVNEEFNAYNLEEASVMRKIARNKSKECGNDFGVSRNNEKLTYTSTKLCGGLEDLYFEPNASSSDRSLLEIQIGANLKAKKTSFEGLTDRSKKSKENVGLYNQLKQLEVEKNELEKQKNSSCMARNLVYPLAMLLLLLLTSITVMLVIQNTIELLIGIKALPLSSRQFTLGISSLSKLGVFGATLEILLIFYLGTCSFVGFYALPMFARIRPKRRKTSLSHLIANSLLILILTSALPLLIRILGITNFDLLGDLGEIEWLGNFVIVLSYNFIFIISAGLCIINKFSATVRREIVARLGLSRVLRMYFVTKTMKSD